MNFQRTAILTYCILWADSLFLYGYHNYIYEAILEVGLPVMLVWRSLVKVFLPLTNLTD